MEGWRNQLQGCRNQPWGWRTTRSHPEQVEAGGGTRAGADTPLSQLLEMKSTDRKQTLLHYLVRVITEKYPELTGFHTELHFLDKAGAGSAAGTAPGGSRRVADPAGGVSGPVLTPAL